MKAHKLPPLFLAVLLQLLPVARQWLMNLTSALPSLPDSAVVFRWGVGAVAAFGAFDAVSGASTTITSAKTATGTNGVAFSYRITTGPEVANTFAASPLPPNLTVNTSTGYITGTPATTGTFTINLTASDSNKPDRTVTATLTLTIGSGVSATPPSITTQPASQSVALGSTVVLNVNTTGTAPLRYQWRLNAANLTTATNASLSLPNIQTNQAGAYSVVVSNSAGTATSANANVTVLVTPAITTQPQNQSVLPGNPATFTVIATGSTPLNYQWRFNNANITGATSAMFTLPSAQTTDAGSYSVTVSNAAGTVTSASATLTVLAAPSITAQPQAQSVVAGNPATFTVTATGTAPLTYQWRLNGANLFGATAATFNLAAAQATDAGNYSVVVANAAGSVTSTVATLTVLIAPTITSQPQPQSVVAGNTATFTVVAGGTAPLSYQWRFNGAAIVGATGATLTLTNVQAAAAGNYSVLVSNIAGNATSANAALTVQQAAVAPTITTSPASQTVATGASVTFTVSASGTAPFSYRWRFNGTTVSGATGSALTLNNVQATNAGAYSVIVSNVAGSATSADATLTVQSLVAPSITTQPQSLTVMEGGTVTFNVTATGTAPLTYQWRRNGVAVTGATTPTLSWANCQTNQAGAYSVIVSNSAGTATSANASLTVLQPPAIVTQPASQTISAGGNVSFSVVATGTAPLTYQWQFNGTAVTGANNATWALSNVQSNQAGLYSVLVSNAAGNVTSASALLTVQAPTTVFTLVVTGTGSVSPNLNGQNLAIGQTYTLVATPGDGQQFSGWSGSMTLSDPTISFVMQPGLALEATFTPIPPTHVAAGSYAGLFYETNGAQFPHAGLVTLRVANTGKFKGTLQIGASRYSFTKQFDETGHANANANCSGQVPLTVDLQPDAAGDGVVVSGTIGDGTWASDTLADRATDQGQFAGKYTLPLPDETGAPSSGTATISIDTRGTVKVKGVLADGTKVKQRATVAPDGTWPLYLPIKGGGALIGWMKIQDAVTGTVQGDVLWLPASP